MHTLRVIVQLAKNYAIVFEKSYFNIKDCISQTIDGADNMSGQNKGCAVFLEEKVVLAVQNYYANHDFSLVPGKSSKVPEIHIMLDSMKQLGIFFKYLPKRCHRFEDCVEKHSATFLQTDSLPKRSVRCFANRNEWKNHCT